MLEFIPFIVAIVGFVIVFYMFRALIVFIGDELANIIATYKDDTASISQQLAQTQADMKAQAAFVSAEFEKISVNYRQTTVAILEHAQELVRSLREIEKAANRQNELENEIIKLKSILSRKEKRHV